MIISAVIQPAMLTMLARRPKRTLWFMMSSIFGPGAALMRKVAVTKIHQVLRFMAGLSFGYWFVSAAQEAGFGQRGLDYGVFRLDFSLFWYKSAILTA